MGHLTEQDITNVVWQLIFVIVLSLTFFLLMQIESHCDTVKFRFIPDKTKSICLPPHDHKINHRPVWILHPIFPAQTAVRNQPK